MSLFEQFCVWCQNLAFSQAMRDSVWKFAMAQALHLCAMSVLIGALLIVDLRMLNRGLKQQPVGQIARSAQPWLVGSFLAMIVTGGMQFVTNAHSRYYSSPIFRWKMGLLVVALIFTFTLRRWVALGDQSRVSPTLVTLVALASIVLWTSVAIGGRAIGFF
jgi:Family of unknown function (DUF6644)